MPFREGEPLQSRHPAADRGWFAVAEVGEVSENSRDPSIQICSARCYLIEPGCVPAMKASLIAPGRPSAGVPVVLSTATNTMLPGGSNLGGSLRSPIHVLK